MKSANSLYADMATTIFTTMSALAAKHDAINLGQGFPDHDGPEWVRQAAAQAILDGPNQYPMSTGVPDLRQAVAEHDERFYGLKLDPDREVIVTSGATEALADCFFALLNPGDEAIVLEPFYDSYVPQIKAAGGVPRFVRLEPPHWTLDEDALRAAFGPRTKLLVLNTPMNPAGKVFSWSELELIAGLLQEFDAFAVCDEVYEHLLFDQRPHIPLMTLPDMRKRCLRIGSAGKTFSLTGWKIGYISADVSLAEVVARSHQFITFTSVPALQLGVARGLRAGDEYFQDLVREQQACRDLLSAGLERVGFGVVPSQGTYFVTTDIRPLGYQEGDFAFCRHITEHAKVAAVPLSVFYAGDNGSPPTSFVRFCFSKDPRVLNEAIARLEHALV